MTRDDRPTALTRRHALAAASSAAGLALWGPAARALGPNPRGRAFLTDAEERFLRAACDRIIPADDWPSASEAGVLDFIDFQLATDYGAGRFLYLKGPWTTGTDSQGWQLRFTPAQFMRRCVAAADDAAGGFAALPPGEQDAFLTELQEGAASLGPDLPAETFFEELMKLTNQGYFADPVYLGNRNMAGWRMVGFPGPHAYYLTEVDNYHRPYFRPPTPMAATPRAREG